MKETNMNSMVVRKWRKEGLNLEKKGVRMENKYYWQSKTYSPWKQNNRMVDVERKNKTHYNNNTKKKRMGKKMNKGKSDGEQNIEISMCKK